MVVYIVCAECDELQHNLQLNCMNLKIKQFSKWAGLVVQYIVLNFIVYFSFSGLPVPPQYYTDSFVSQVYGSMACQASHIYF